MNCLKDLEYLKDKLKKANITYKTEPLDNIETALKRLEELEIMYSNCAIDSAEQKKALEIIKEKEIDVALFKECPNYDEYMEWCREKAKLTLQEYELLKGIIL